MNLLTALCFLCLFISLSPSMAAPATVLFQAWLATHLLSLSLSPIIMHSGTNLFKLMIWQGFNWESSNKNGWYNSLKSSVPDLANAGITHVWLPPSSQSAGSGEGISNFLFFRLISYSITYYITSDPRIMMVAFSICFLARILGRGLPNLACPIVLIAF